MMERCSEHVAAWLVRSHAIEEGDRELYAYAAYSFFLNVSPLLLSLFFGAALGKLWQSVVLVIPFMALRKFSGGYHAKHPQSCMAVSCLLLLLCLFLSSHLHCGIWLNAADVCAAFSLSVLSPVDSENRRLDPEEKRRYQRTASVLAFFFCGVCICLALLGADALSVCISTGLLLTAGMQVPCLVFQ